MTSKCPNCGKNFDTAKGMRIHKADCLKKDPFGVKGTMKKMQKDNIKMRKRMGL
jgi:hypothetical protein